MLYTLVLTLFIEGLVVTGYAHWQRKPLVSILLTASLGSLLTQGLLWLVLSLFYQHYLGVLLVAEVLIWFLEGLLLWRVPVNRLVWREALGLSLVMNLASFGAGWLLPL